MKKGAWIVLLAGCLFMGFFVRGEVQRAAQNLPITSRQFDETKQDLARLKAEVERLTKFIKVTESTVQIEAPQINLDGHINLNSKGGGSVRVNSNSFFYGTVYGYNAHFSLI